MAYQDKYVRMADVCDDDDVAVRAQWCSSKCAKLTIAMLVILVIIAVVAVAALAVHVLLNSGKQHSGEATQVCTSLPCLQLSVRLLSSMNTSVDPCDGFYNFSCGNWDKVVDIPPGTERTGYEPLLQQGYNNRKALSNILKDENYKPNVNALQKMKSLYKSCMNVTAIQSRGWKPLVDLIRSTGGWQDMGIPGDGTEWTINGTQFQREKMYGSQAFYRLAVGVDPKNSSRNTLTLGQPVLSLSSAEAYLDSWVASQNLETLRALIQDFLNCLNPNGTVDTRAIAGDILDFEIKLASIFDKLQDQDPEAQYNRWTVGTLSTLWPDYDWLTAIKHFFSQVSITVDGSEQVIVTTPTYFRKLSELYQVTNRSTLENYAKWTLMQKYQLSVASCNTPAASAYNAIRQDVVGVIGTERSQACVAAVELIMPLALARVFYEYILPVGSRGNISEMVVELRQAMRERVGSREWLDEETRKRATEKVDAITDMIAYPDQILNDTYLDWVYAEYNISQWLLFENVVQYFKVLIQTNFATLRKPVDRTVWLEPPTASNAYYYSPFNAIVIPEGILNLPVYSAGWPNYMKYGGLGMVIGHELTHGFDNKGRLYDKNGNLKPWWTNSSIRNFVERQECFEQQYSQYQFLGHNVNGNLTLGENIADNGGLKASYQAYLTQRGSQSPNLPGVSYSHDQLFFIAFAQLWCTHSTPESAAISTMRTHSPSPIRVIGALVNNKDFSRAFGCPAGSRMNPNNKCLLW